MIENFLLLEFFCQKTLLLEGIMPLRIDAVEQALRRAEQKDPESIISHLVRIAFPRQYYENVQLGVTRRKTRNIRNDKYCLSVVLGYPDPLNRPFVGDCNKDLGEKRITALIGIVAFSLSFIFSSNSFHA